MEGRFQAGLASGLSQFQKVSLVPKLLCGIFLLFYLLGFMNGVESNLIVTPGFLVPPHAKLWTPFTAQFYEKSLIWVLLDIVALLGFSLILEPLWGLKEFLVFSVIVSSASILLVALLCLLVYTATGSVTILFVNIHGFLGLVCGYLVAVKQAHPESVAFPPPAPPTLRVLHLPLLVTIMALLFGILKLISFVYCLLSFSGMTVSWIYLRFYQRKESGRGDLAETFAFATFFPEFMHPIVSVFGENMFRLLVRIKVCPKVVKTYDVGAPSSIKISLPGTTPIDAERRKQKALKALDERLNKTTSQINWPSLEDNASNDENSTPAPPTLPPHLSSSSSPSSSSIGRHESQTATNSNDTVMDLSHGGTE